MNTGIALPAGYSFTCLISQVNHCAKSILGDMHPHQTFAIDVMF